MQVERLTDDPDSPSYKDDRKRFAKLFGGNALEKAGVAAVVQQLSSTVRSIRPPDNRRRERVHARTPQFLATSQVSYARPC